MSSALRGRGRELRPRRALRVRPGRCARVRRPPAEVRGSGSGARRKPRPRFLGCRLPPHEPLGHLARRSGRFGGEETGSLAVSRRWRWWGLQTRRQGPCALVGARPWEVGEMLMNPRYFRKAGKDWGKSLALAEDTQGSVRLPFTTRCV